MIMRRNSRKQDGGIRDALSHIGGEEKDNVLPPRVHELERRDQRVAEDHERRADPHEREELAPARHDDAGRDGAHGRGEGRDGEAGAGPGGGV